MDADARAGMLKSLAEAVAQQCKREEEEEEDDDEQDGLRSKKPKISMSTVCFFFYNLQIICYPSSS